MPNPGGCCDGGGGGKREVAVADMVVGRDDCGGAWLEIIVTMRIEALPSDPLQGAIDIPSSIQS